MKIPAKYKEYVELLEMVKPAGTRILAVTSHLQDVKIDAPAQSIEIIMQYGDRKQDLRHGQSMQNFYDCLSTCNLQIYDYIKLKNAVKILFMKNKDKLEYDGYDFNKKTVFLVQFEKSALRCLS